MNFSVLILAQLIVFLALTWALLINSWHPFFFLFFASGIGSSVEHSCTCKKDKDKIKDDKFTK